MAKKDYTNILIYLFIALLIGINIPYVIAFSFNLSKNSNDWSNYSNYISGILNPIISLVGIFLIIKEYSKSILIRHEDNIMKVVEKLEYDMNKVFDYRIFFHFVAGKSDEEIPFVRFLRFKSSIDFLSIKILRGDVKLETKLLFEIMQTILLLNIIFKNVNKLSEEYVEYYYSKYQYVLDYLFKEEYYAYKIVFIDKAFKDDANVKCAIDNLRNAWVKSKKFA